MREDFVPGESSRSRTGRQKILAHSRNHDELE